MTTTPQTHIKFRVTYGNKGMSVAENELPRYPDEVLELQCGATMGDLFQQLYLRYTITFSQTLCAIFFFQSPIHDTC